MLEIGDRIKLKATALELSYVKARKHYTNMYEGKLGTIICFAGTGKPGIEFDDIVFPDFKTKKSSHDNGCFGKGKLHFCWFIPEAFLEKIETSDDTDYFITLL